MAHPAVRIVADWLAGVSTPDYGVNAVAAAVPRFAGHAAPSPVVVYDECRHGWVARGQVPSPPTGITFPAVVVTLVTHASDGALQAADTDALLEEGEVSVAVQLVQRDVDTEAAAQAAMYLLRALRGSLAALDRPQHQSARTGAGVRLQPSLSRQQAKLEESLGDVVSAGAIVVTYPVWETTPLTANE